VKLDKLEKLRTEFESQQQNSDDNLNPVLRCVCNTLKLVICATDMAPEPYRRFIPHLLQQDTDQQ
jgi:hypothetical protein